VMPASTDEALARACEQSGTVEAEVVSLGS
jgi:hypothetical protein